MALAPLPRRIRFLPNKKASLARASNITHLALTALLNASLMLSTLPILSILPVLSYANDTLDDEEIYSDDFEMDFDEEGGREGDSVTGKSKPKKTLIPAYFTLSHTLAYPTRNGNHPVVNRSALRAQMDYGFGEHYFLRLDAKAEVDQVYRGEAQYQSVSDEYYRRSKARELFIQASLGPLSVKIGQQLVIWGKADSGVITDVFSPRDLRESIFTPVENSRLGQTMIVADYYIYNQESQQQFSLVVNPDIDVNEFARPGHPYGPNLIPNASSLDAQFNNAIILANSENVAPGFSLPDAEFGLRWTYTRDNFDVALMVADLVDNNPIIILNEANNDLFSAQRPTTILTTILTTSPTTLPATSPTTLNSLFTSHYKRYQMLGGGFNWGDGNFVWKGEFAFKRGLSFNRLRPEALTENIRNIRFEQVIRAVKRDSAEFAFGFDYDHNGQLSASLELTHQALFNHHDAILLQGRDESSNLYGVVTQKWRNDTLTGSYTSGYQIQDKDLFHRLELSYDISDKWSTTIRGDYFQIKDATQSNSLFGALANKDRVSLQVNYDF
ncbi:MAG: hypothetical protein COA42_10360 [Alteromonadaceae bacterium]|nr:MAG: hypothetical protein COA42_10360 [Alteromonadaceae bacterium]